MDLILVLEVLVGVQKKKNVFFFEVAKRQVGGHFWPVANDIPEGSQSHH
jgi:hypothetical protein